MNMECEIVCYIGLLTLCCSLAINKQNIDNSECVGVNMLKFIQKWLRNNFLKKYGFGWLKLYTQTQSSVKSIRKCKKKSLYHQPKPYFFKKLLRSHFWINFNIFTPTHSEYKVKYISLH
jgi:hypothetical protein